MTGYLFVIQHFCSSFWPATSNRTSSINLDFLAQPTEILKYFYFINNKSISESCIIIIPISSRLVLTIQNLKISFLALHIFSIQYFTATFKHSFVFYLKLHRLQTSQALHLVLLSLAAKMRSIKKYK